CSSDLDDTAMSVRGLGETRGARGLSSLQALEVLVGGQHHGRHGAVAVVDAHDLHALGRASVAAHLRHAGADDDALVGEHQQLLVAADRGEGDHVAGLRGDLVADDALAAAPLQRELRQARALAQARLGEAQQLGALLLLLGDHRQAHHGVVALEADADHALGGAAGVAGAVLLEADGLALAGAEHHVGAAVGDAHRHQLVAVDEVDGHQAGDGDVDVVADEGALDEAVAGGEDEVAVAVEAVDRQHRLHVLVLGHVRQHVADVLAARVALDLLQVVDLLAVDAPAVGEEQQVVVGAAHQQLGVEVVVLDALVLGAAPAARLAAVAGERRALDVAAVGERDDHLLLGDQVVLGDVVVQVGDGGAARVVERLLLGDELGADHALELLVLGEDQLEARDLLLQLAVLLLDLLALQAREALQAHVEHGLRLRLGEAELAHEAVARLGAVLRGADQLDHGVEVVEGDEVALEDVRPLARLAQLVLRAPADDLTAVQQEIGRAHV